MKEQRRAVAVASPGKVYKGIVDIANPTFMTSDLFNSPSIYWKYSKDKCFDDAVLLCDVQLRIGGSAICVKFDKLQSKIFEIIYFYDDPQAVTDDKEKMRASSMSQKIQEHFQLVDTITTGVVNFFYHLTATFFGLFKKKSNDKFIPLTDVKLVEIYNKDGKWFQKIIELPYKFIGVKCTIY